MLQHFRASFIMLSALTILTGVVYPAVVTVIAQTAFPHQANGSLIRQGDQIVGSELIGQQFSKPQYFWGRLSATGPVPYHAAASSGSNYGPLNPALKAAAEGRLSALVEHGARPENAPVDLVTASGSGLDPHISTAAAMFQVPRVAAARGMSEDAVRELVARYTEGRQLGVLGEPRLNVLRLNLALDQRSTGN
ncbi:MAG: potassium-transporting ATPase subunit C [Planctomycetales bacterium 12-60-4]|nr:MAG: potassium-transporting ATPase subunit C [Planctomycetales bacterium 12-60-4]